MEPHRPPVHFTLVQQLIGPHKGLRRELAALGWALLLGAAGALSAFASAFLNLGLDREMKLTDGDARISDGGAVRELRRHCRA